MDMFFASVEGHIVPVQTSNGKPEGFAFFTLTQASARFGIDVDTLTEMYRAAFAGDTTAPPIRPSQDPKWAIYRKVRCPDATDDAFDYFIRLCEERGLSPWADQAYLDVEANKDGNPIPKVIVGIGGVRKIAHDTGQYVGIDATTFDEDGGRNPLCASVVVYRLVDGERRSFVGEVKFDERCPKTEDGEIVDPFWFKMPYDSLGRCAEAAALRRAFAQELNGLYIAEELCLMRGQRHRWSGRRSPAKRISLVERGLPADRLALESFLVERCNANRQQRASLMAKLAEEFRFADAVDGEPFAAAAQAVLDNPAKYGLAA